MTRTGKEPRKAAFGRSFERAMAMSDSVWARHANPWSFYTRIPILPLLALAIVARVWIGWWCLVPVALVCAWVFLNPRVFAPPRNLASYAARGVMGERVWLARATSPIPPHHARAAMILSAVSGLGILPLGYGLWTLDAAAILLGLVLSMGAKLWFVDRMVWLYDDVGAGRFAVRGDEGASPPAGEGSER